MVKDLMKQVLIVPMDATLPKMKDAIFWIIWYIGSVILIDGVLTNNPFELGYSMSRTYFLGMLMLVLAFHNKTYMREVLSSKYRNLSMSIFSHSLIFIIIMIAWPIVIDRHYNLAPLVRESTIVIYWILSLVLLFVENLIIRYFSAIFIYAVCLLYSSMLEKLYFNYYYISFSYKLCVCGTCALALAVSMLVIKKE